jgi:hypothetical protein
MGIDGTFGVKDTDPSEYDKQITELVTALLLKIFGYSGPHFVLGVGKKNM